MNFPFLFEICFSSLHDTVISTTHEQRRGTLYDKKVQYPVVLYIRLTIQFTIAFEDDTSNAIFEEDVANHVKFKICLVFKPLVHAVFSNFCKLSEKCLLSAGYLKNM